MDNLTSALKSNKKRRMPSTATKVVRIISPCLDNSDDEEAALKIKPFANEPNELLEGR